MEHMMRFRARQPMSNLNQREWYMSNRFIKLNSLNIPGLKPLANSTLSRCGICGMTVPRIDAIARMIRSRMVSLTELKRRQTVFDFVFEVDFVITVFR
jgi:hypothetical protein